MTLRSRGLSSDHAVRGLRLEPEMANVRFTLISDWLICLCRNDAPRDPPVKSPVDLFLEGGMASGRERKCDHLLSSVRAK